MGQLAALPRVGYNFVGTLDDEERSVLLQTLRTGQRGDGQRYCGAVEQPAQNTTSSRSNVRPFFTL